MDTATQSTPAATYTPPSGSPPAVVVTDIQMPFGSMVMFMVKWTLASIPALLILGAVAFGVFVLIGGIGAAVRGTGATSATSALDFGSPAVVRRARETAAKSDLRNLVTAEEVFFSSKAHYTDDLSRIPFQHSTGVTVTIEKLIPGGWVARARTTDGADCWIGVNMDVNTVAPSSVPRASEGVPVCAR